jgi:hypothetical protein
MGRAHPKRQLAEQGRATCYPCRRARRLSEASITIEQAVDRYLAGEPVEALRRLYGFDVNFLRKELADRGIPLRGRGEAKKAKAALAKRTSAG